MNDTVVTLPLTAGNANLVADLRAQHRSVMSLFPALQDSVNPRADIGVLFRVLLPSDPGADPRALTLMVRSHLELPDSTPTVLPQLNQELEVQVRLAAEKRLTVRQGTKRTTRSRPVPDDEIEMWITNLFALHGFQVSPGSLRCSPSHRRGLTRGVFFDSRDVRASIRVAEQDLAQHAWTTGLGRAKSYGFGLLLPL